MNNNRRKNASRSTVDDGGSVTSAGEESNGLALSDFIVYAVAPFLGVRSLVRFGATSKSHAVVVSKEVERRKACISAAEDEVKRLTMKGLERQSPPGVPTRQNIIMARKIVENVERLINDELPAAIIYGGGLTPDNRSSDFFRRERRKFWPGDNTLYILPDIFYFPPEGESSSPSLELVLECYRMSSELTREWFHFPEIRIVCYGMMDAFRVVARDLFFDGQESVGFLEMTLEKAHDLFTTCWNENESISTNLGRMRMRSVCREHA
jgi:hypothetical protein